MEANTRWARFVRVSGNSTLGRTDPWPSLICQWICSSETIFQRNIRKLSSNCEANFVTGWRENLTLECEASGLRISHEKAMFAGRFPARSLHLSRSGPRYCVSRIRATTTVMLSRPPPRSASATSPWHTSLTGTSRLITFRISSSLTMSVSPSEHNRI